MIEIKSKTQSCARGPLPLLAFIANNRTGQEIFSFILLRCVWGRPRSFVASYPRFYCNIKIAIRPLSPLPPTMKRSFYPDTIKIYFSMIRCLSTSRSLYPSLQGIEHMISFAYYFEFGLSWTFFWIFSFWLVTMLCS